MIIINIYLNPLGFYTLVFPRSWPIRNKGYLQPHSYCCHQVVDTPDNLQICHQVVYTPDSLQICHQVVDIPDSLQTCHRAVDMPDS